MLVPELVVWGPGLVWVLQQVGTVRREKSVPPRGFKPAFSGRALHPTAIFPQSSCACRDDTSLSTVDSHFASFCR